MLNIGEQQLSQDEQATQAAIAAENGEGPGTVAFDNALSGTGAYGCIAGLLNPEWIIDQLVELIPTLAVIADDIVAGNLAQVQTDALQGIHDVAATMWSNIKQGLLGILSLKCLATAAAAAALAALTKIFPPVAVASIVAAAAEQILPMAWDFITSRPAQSVTGICFARGPCPQKNTGPKSSPTPNPTIPPVPAGTRVPENLTLGGYVSGDVVTAVSSPPCGSALAAQSFGFYRWLANLYFEIGNQAYVLILAVPTGSPIPGQYGLSPRGVTLHIRPWPQSYGFTNGQPSSVVLGATDAHLPPGSTATWSLNADQRSGSVNVPLVWTKGGSVLGNGSLSGTWSCA